VNRLRRSTNSIRAWIVIVILHLAGAAAAVAAWSPPAGVDLTRPRLLLRQGEIVAIQERLGREPYRGLLAGALRRINQADGVSLDDDSIAAHRIKARAAKNLAFLYAIDRTRVDGEVVALSKLGQRQAVGDRARDLLLHLFPRCRLAVDPPLGGWDRDISSSEELLQYAVAYDTLLGAGYDFSDDHQAVVERIADLASEMYENYVRPESARNFSNLHQNNHRSKTGASLVVAGLALADHEPAAGSDPRGVRDPQLWIDYGLDLVDVVTRWVLVTGDGAYAEGPFYWRFTMENMLPMARAWHRLLGGATYVTATGLPIRDFWTHPLFAASGRWMLDMTLPDGSLAPLDDGNPGRSFAFGLLPTPAHLAAAFAWRWQNAPAPFEVEGNVDLAADAIVAFDDSVTPAPPPGSPTAFYLEGGNAILRSDWTNDAVVVMVQGEHDTASSFGRDRSDKGVGPQSHEHAEPGAFLLHAFGERLLLDPGYLNFSNREAVNQPEHHNLILVDGKGPVDYLNATLRWNRRSGRPPIDGNATLSDAVDTAFADAVRVTTRYGLPTNRAARMQRRFVHIGDRTVVVADDVVGPPDPPRRFTWLLHGNGGEESGGTFETTPHGGVWTRSAARLSGEIVFDNPSPEYSTMAAVHEEPGNRRSSHTTLHSSVVGDVVRSLALLHPSRSAAGAPTIRDISDATMVGLELDSDDDVRVISLRRRDGGSGITYGDVGTDGSLLIIESGQAGPPRRLWAEAATYLQVSGVRVAETDGSPDVVAVHNTGSTIDVLAPGAESHVTLRALGFAAAGLDHACSATTDGSTVVVGVAGLRQFQVHATSTNGRPSADAGTEASSTTDRTVVLDGSASCDPEQSTLQYRWQLVSAPPGSAWSLEEASTAHPRLTVDRSGSYRIRLTVTDETGQESLPAEVLVVGGGICANGRDDDLDGLFDSDDADCDRGRLCRADCNGDGAVSIDELVRGTSIAHGQRSLLDCDSFDRDANLRVTAAEITTAIATALGTYPATCDVSTTEPGQRDTQS